jgi:hypothetical protein
MIRAARTRRESKRESVEVRAARAATLLDNAEVRAKFDEVRGDIIKDIETVKLDGSEASERKAVECVRQLQALLAVKRAILRPLAAERLKNVNSKT